MRRHNLLDCGYLKLVEFWGSEEKIIESARMSTDGNFRAWGPIHQETCDVYDCTCQPEPGDEKLLAYLYRNNHATPFEMAGFTVEVQAPIFVVREWVRHRTMSYNELSGRYTPIPDINYVPTMDRLLSRPKGNNNQTAALKGAAMSTEEQAWDYRQALMEHYERDEILYQQALRLGVPKELARVHLPVGRYTRMRVSANLRNWLGFLKLRLPDNAQYEIRVYANTVAQLLADLYPRTHKLFMEEIK